ncbi:hypothetical protein OAT16_03795 [Prolixibacteraceae bacterium]|nr:hypothetical protein [Prolixibacteraceae bacterium]
MRKILLVIVALVSSVNISVASTKGKAFSQSNDELFQETVFLRQRRYSKPKKRKIRSEFNKRAIWDNRINFAYGMNWNIFSGIKTESRNTGYTFDASFHHFAWESLALGMEVSLNKCLFDNGDFNYEDKATFHLIDQDLKHQTSVFFVGPSVMTRTAVVSNNLVLYASISAGYAFCNMIDRNNTPNKYDLSFGGFGMLWRGGMDISIAENIYFNIEGNFFRTSSKSFNSMLNDANHEFILKDGLGLKYNNYGVNLGLVFSF